MVLFLAGNSRILLKVRIQVYGLHVHVQGRADGAIICWIIIDGPVLGALTDALTSFKHRCVTSIVADLLWRARSAHSWHRWKLLKAHFNIGQLYVPLLRAM